MFIRDMLARIPDLAAEVWLTRGAPNPSGEIERHPLTFESKPPTSVAVLDALRPIDPDGDSITPLWHLCQAVRVAWDEIRASGEDVRNLPAQSEHATYASEAGWLLATMGLWQAVVDEFAWGYIEQEIKDCYGELVRLAREPKPLVMWCQVDGCGGKIKPIPVMHGDREVLHAEYCEFGHQIDRHEAARRAARMADMSLPEIAVELGVTDRTLRRWAEAGLIRRTRRVDGIDLYRFEDVYRVHIKRIEWRIQA